MASDGFEFSSQAYSVGIVGEPENGSQEQTHTSHSEVPRTALLMKVVSSKMLSALPCYFP
jgi:hypothetical protein